MRKLSMLGIIVGAAGPESWLHGPRSVTSLLVFIQQGLKRLSPHENPSLMRVRTMISPSSIWPRWAAT
jgi:hypothetical protein